MQNLPDGYVLSKGAKGRDTTGLKFKKGDHDSITIKKAKLDPDYPSQSVDYVSYIVEGNKYVARNGDHFFEHHGNIMRKDIITNKITTLPKEEMQRLGIKGPRYHPEVHIPLDEFLSNFMA